MNFQFNGKKVWVTGASRGIGYAIATQFAALGAEVVVSATSLENLSPVLELAKENNWNIHGVKLNFADDTWLDDIELLCQDFKAPDILINNAGITSDGIFMRQGPEVCAKSLQINLQSAAELSRRVVRSMMKAKSGRIINISSVVASTGNAGQAHYCAAKAGLEGLTRGLAREVGSRGITVNAIAPGLIETAMTNKLTDAQKERALQEIPLGRAGQPDDIASTVLFLASDFAGYITGQTLHVNGGMHMS